MAQPRSKQELDRLAVDFPVSTKDEPYQTTSDRFKNVQTERLTNPTREAAEQKRRIAQKQAEFEEYRAAALYQENFEQERQIAIAQAAVANQAAELNARTQTSPSILSAQQLARNTSTMWWVVSWNIWLWLSFQVPLGIIAVAFASLHAALESTTIGRVVQGAIDTVNNVTSFFGIDFSALAPINLSMGLTFLVFSLCILSLLCTMLTYALRGQNPFGGDRAIQKFGTLLLCFIGYSVPLLNLFPWVAFYIYVMWRSKS